MNQILRHINDDLTDFRLDCTLLGISPGRLPRMGWGSGRGVTLTYPSRQLALPPAVPLDAKVLAILVPIPDQQLTAWPDHLAGWVEVLPVILEGHQVLLLIVPGTVHIPGVEAKKGMKPQVKSALHSQTMPSSFPSVSEATVAPTMAGMLFSPYLTSHFPEPISRPISTWTVHEAGYLQLL